MVFENQAGFEVIGDASNGREAVQLALQVRPDVVLMDLTMPAMGGNEAIRQIHRDLPLVRIIALSGYLDESRVIEAVRAGAVGYVVKDAPLDELRLAIQTVARQNTYFSSRVSADLPLSDLLRQAQQPELTRGTNALSTREREVLQLLAEGHSNQAVAKELCLSVKTVESHRSHIIAKTDAKSRTDLIRYALRLGIISFDVLGRHAPLEDVA